MDRHLKKLMKLMPPPEKPRNSDVDWEKLEEAVGLKYPTSFKDYISVYGGTIWFGDFCPHYVTGRNEKEIKEYLRLVKGRLKYLKGNMYDEKMNKINLPLYPEPGGLFPFMLDDSSDMYLWRTEGKNPDKWPFIIWFTGEITVLEKMTISQMFCQIIEGKPPMAELIYSMDMLEPHRQGIK